VISARSWWLVVAILGGGASLLLAVVFRYVPSTADLLDPLGRPATLTKSIVSSSAGLDQVTAVLVPKQAELTHRISVLTALAGSLDEVVDHAGELTPLAGDANRGIAHVVHVARPLPALITRITAHANEATGVAHDLGGTVTSLNRGLSTVGDRLVSLHTSLGPLTPRADAIAEVLAQIERESQRIAPVSPVLGLLSRATHR
jgi:ABC-type transporter Mla subunit MlaD